MKMMDYHLHSTFSPDSHQSPENLILAAIEKGLSEIVVTDHFDPESTNLADNDFISFKDYFKIFSSLKEKYENEITVKIGIEFGLKNEAGYNKLFEECLKLYDFDFVIGSIHKVENLWIDLSPYLNPRTVLEANFDYYKYLYETIKNNKCFDVLGHINVIDRYTKGEVLFSDIKDIVTKILKLIIEDGKGIEINTSGPRKFMTSKTLPNVEILKLYKKLGGEIITIGSDAHYEKNIAKNFSYTFEMLRELGFKGYFSFDKRVKKFNSFE